MTKKYLFVLALALGGCPAFEIPSSDAGLPDDFDSDAMGGRCVEGADGGVCDEQQVEPGPGQGGRGGGLASGGASGSTQGGSGGAGGAPFVPGGPIGDIGQAWGQALDHLYSVVCQCSEVPSDQCLAMHAEERACEIANVDANAEIAGAWLECAIMGVHEQADCMAKAACDPNAILDCVAVTADGQDHITARCGEPPAGIIEGEECSSGHDVPPFPCFGGGEVPAQAVCDGIADCADGSDEMICEEPTDEYYQCGDGEQIYADWVCDGEADCTNGSDESSCEPVDPGPEDFSCGDGSSVPLSWVCDGTPDCGNGSDERDCSAGI